MPSTRIVLKHRKYRRTHPWLCHGVPGQLDADCPSFAAALDYAKTMGCDSIEVAKSHMPRDGHLRAKIAGIALVVTE